MAINIIQLFEGKNPSYPSIYRELLNQVATFGGDNRSEEKRNKQGRAFSNGYEVFMYAAILGMTRDEQCLLRGCQKSVSMSNNNGGQLSYMKTFRAVINEGLKRGYLSRELYPYKNQFNNGGYAFSHMQVAAV